MTSWRVIGDLYSSGVPGWLGWSEGGTLTGSAEALADVDAFLHRFAMVPCAGPGPWLPADRSDSVCCAALAFNVMANIEAVVGEPPELPGGDVPDGAVA